MKIKCRNCGKMFDPEKTSSMCPKCGTWYTSANHYDSGNSGQNTIYDCGHCQDADRANRQNGANEINRKNPNSDARRTVIISILGVSLIVLFRVIIGVISYVSDHSDRNRDYTDIFDEEEDDMSDEETDEGDGNFYVDNIPVTGYAYGDRIVSEGSSGYSGWLEINSVEPVKMDDADVPDGYVVYDMSYDMGVQGDAADDNLDEEYDISDSFDVYLRSNSWKMLKPMSQDDIDELMSEDGYAEDHDIAEDLDPDYGHLYFLVRSGDYGYMVVYGQNVNSSDDLYDSINNIYVVGDKADASVWYDVSTLDITKGKLYKIYNGDWGQKLEKGSTYTLPGGAEITNDEICELSGIDLDDDEYDFYLVSDILLNHGARTGSYNLMVFDTDSDTDPIEKILPYSEYSDDELTPMSVVYQYIVYGIRKGQSKNISVAYEFGSSLDELQYDSAALPVPE